MVAPRRLDRLKKAARLAAVALGAAAAAAVPATTARAATQGNIGANSTGSTTISARSGIFIWITGLDDLDFGTWNGSSNLTRDSFHCVGTNQATRRFNIRAVGSGAGGAFTLSNGSGGTLAFSAAYRSATGANRALAPNVVQTGHVGVALSACRAGSQTMRLRLTISTGQFGAARDGVYTGTLTLTVAPE
jgi:hypothetical protein